MTVASPNFRLSPETVGTVPFVTVTDVCDTLPPAPAVNVTVNSTSFTLTVNAAVFPSYVTVTVFSPAVTNEVGDTVYPVT